MSIAATFVLALGLSADAFAAALGKGAALGRPSLLEALRTGVIFGVIEAITPIIGWAAGLAASTMIERYDHWVAFALLAIVGGKMAWEGLTRNEPRADDTAPQRHGFFVLAITAIGTSIDAMAVGVSLAVLDVDIAVTALVIGFVTFAAATSGTLLGRLVGPRLGGVAEVAGGLCLIAIGIKTLIDHHAFS